eukprot:scaffold1300_cov317-Prasinococcus_capsulatus_cf.AAC.5
MRPPSRTTRWRGQDVTCGATTQTFRAPGAPWCPSSTTTATTPSTWQRLPGLALGMTLVSVAHGGACHRTAWQQLSLWGRIHAPSLAAVLLGLSLAYACGRRVFGHGDVESVCWCSSCCRHAVGRQRGSGRNQRGRPNADGHLVGARRPSHHG